MTQTEMIQGLRAEIAKLQRVLDMLLDESSEAKEVHRPERPKGSGTKATSFNPEEFSPRKRTMSAEGKARIAAAQKKRWAVQKGASPDRIDRKQAAPTKKTSRAVPPKVSRKIASEPTTNKSAGAGKRTRSTQKRAATAATTKIATKKSAITKNVKPATKRPAKKVSAARPEPQTTA